MLMNPTINTRFDGVQFDDILGAHRGYGDFFEKSNDGAGNDLAENATPLGFVAASTRQTLGSDGRLLRIRNQTDFVSIDDDGDTDWFSFEVGPNSATNLRLEPVGPVYNLGPQGGTVSEFNAAQLSDLELALFESDGTTLLASDNSGGLGEADMIEDLQLHPGTYYVRVTGAADEVQMYELSIDVAGIGDFNENGLYECNDVDAMVDAIVQGDYVSAFDLNGDGTLHREDVLLWLDEAGRATLGGPFLEGDANLDGVVDVSDLSVWNDAKFTAAIGWCSGDFSVDGVVDVRDFNIWNAHKIPNSPRSSPYRNRREWHVGCSYRLCFSRIVARGMIDQWRTHHETGNVRSRCTKRCLRAVRLCAFMTQFFGALRLVRRRSPPGRGKNRCAHWGCRTRCRLLTGNRQACQGQVTSPSSTWPSASEAPICGQKSLIAKYSPSIK